MFYESKILNYAQKRRGKKRRRSSSSRKAKQRSTTRYGRRLLDPVKQVEDSSSRFVAVTNGLMVFVINYWEVSIQKTHSMKQLIKDLDKKEMNSMQEDRLRMGDHQVQ